MFAKIIVVEEEIMLAEGFKVTRCPVSRSLEGKSIAQTKLRPRTGCTMVGIEHGERFISNQAKYDPTCWGCFDVNWNFRSD
ncbi:MAG: hypothetical protein PHS47_03200 [Methanocellales archaeon]|nr:hypothetical protein [Methanocellales archaeon]MDD4898475.1 hypothetical protein [Methanocellales archaeon]MDD5447228.1 hypothetical protein [Methanocellales archaeon]